MINYSLYVWGNPKGFDRYPSDSTSEKFHDLLSSCKAESELVVVRNGQLMQYIYVRRIHGNSELYLGFALMFTGVYCTDCHALNELFDAAYYDVLLKGELLQFKGDKYSYLVSRFADNASEIKRISLFFRTKLDGGFDEKFANIPPSFQVGNGEFTIPLENTDSDINFSVSQYDVVHITNNEIALSELERIQQMLSKLYSEHGKLQEKYRQLLEKKRNFKWVMILSFSLLICVTGIVSLKNLLDYNKLDFDCIEQENKFLHDNNVKLLNELKIVKDSINNLKTDISDRKKTYYNSKVHKY